ncbi:class I SAM-dependent methyltransferase [Aquihabitans sp. McL0605]|uniref:class I SAM-dependent methyltransferase n=1 Tax=Aquihabitans sp. McL0605 TaxID=3415671 RepID=UPI003CEFD4F4
MRDRARRADRPWALGEIGEGEEWLACTFSEQEAQDLTEDQLAVLLNGSDRSWIRAYEGMTLDGDHAWRNHTGTEVDWVREQIGPDAQRVVDVGCGDGRHANILAEYGIDVLGIDIAPRLVERANDVASGSARFAVLDARQGIPEDGFDAALCLYDVLGSSADRNDDERLLSSIRACLRPGGVLVGSAMNTDVTLGHLSIDRRPTTRGELVRTLERLPPSKSMEQTGSVFDVNQLVYFDGVYFRKEQFERVPGRLPCELIVRDRRFGITELYETLVAAGFDVLRLEPVRLGDWTSPLARDDRRAKELIFVARVR